MDSISDFLASDDPRPQHPHHATGLPDELSPEFVVFLDEVYSMEEPLTDLELEELYCREQERILSDEIRMAIVANRQLSDVLAELGLPARVAV